MAVSPLPFSASSEPVVMIVGLTSCDADVDEASVESGITPEPVGVTSIFMARPVAVPTPPPRLLKDDDGGEEASVEDDGTCVDAPTSEDK